MSAKDQGKPTIVVNANDSARRRTFSLAHEFGHYILHDPLKNGEKYRLDYYHYSDDNRQEETEANYFAASLLVPKSRLIWTMRQTDDTRMIANYFGVSEVVITNRQKWIGIEYVYD
jgi:Zn-dependent peptidase ImmA (M78 family)